MSPRKKILFTALLIVVSGFLAFFAAEVILRVAPIPGIGYHTTYYDELTGGNLYPNTTKWYRSARGDFVQRDVNDWGFLDASHEVEKPPGTVRIGFFGDSYTEAGQVSIEHTFFRLIEDDLNERLATVGPAPRGAGASHTKRFEALAFGISGRSTLQSYLECSRWMGRLDLDYIVYVFCENDVSDQIRDLNPVQGIPYAYLKGDSFAVDNSFRDRYRHKISWWHRVWQYAKSHSLVLSTLESRIKLLRRHGIRTRADRDDMQMEAAEAAFVRGAGTGPSAWKSDSLLAYSETLLARVMDAWHADAAAGGREFVVMYVPKERHMDKPIEEQDSWALWLHEYCTDRDIPLVDPSSELVARRDRGEEVFYDHFTPAGHRAVADAFLGTVAK
jgi:hypothetical protein